MIVIATSPGDTDAITGSGINLAAIPMVYITIF
jgi:hypothetical protein